VLPGVTLSRRAKIGIWVGVSAALMFVGALGPWAKAFGVLAVSGTDGDGVIVLIAGLIVGGAAWLHRQGTRLWAVVIGILAAVVGAATSIYDLANIKSVLDNSGVVTVGWGLWLDCIASVSAVVALLVLANVMRATSGVAVSEATTGEDGS
jgi:hypothetical protein